MPSWEKRVGSIEDAKTPERQQYYKDLYEYHKKTTGELSKFEVAKQGEQILKDLNMHKISVGDIGGISKTMFKAYRENVKKFPKTSFVLKRLQVGWKNVDYFHKGDTIEIKDGWFHVYRGGKEMKISLVDGTVEGDLKVAKKKPKAATDEAKKKAEAERKQKEAEAKTELSRKNPFHTSLRTKKLEPYHEQVWSFWTYKDYRIKFRFVSPKKVHFLYISNRKDIYR